MPVSEAATAFQFQMHFVAVSSRTQQATWLSCR